MEDAVGAVVESEKKVGTGGGYVRGGVGISVGGESVAGLHQSAWLKRSLRRLEAGRPVRIRHGSHIGFLSLLCLYFGYFLVRSLLRNGPSLESAMIFLFLAMITWVRFRLVLIVDTSGLVVRNLLGKYEVDFPAKGILVFSEESIELQLPGSRPVPVMAVSGYQRMGLGLSAGPFDARVRFQDVEELVQSVCPSCVADLKR